MHRPSDIALIICFVSIGMIIQAVAQDCDSSRLDSCLKEFINVSVYTNILDKRKICSAALVHLNCLNSFANCDKNLDNNIAITKKLISTYNCGSGNGVGSVVYNLHTLFIGLAFYKLY